MKTTIKIAFYATVAFATLSTVAHADALADLKSMIEKLNTRDAGYQAAVHVPDGFTVYPMADSATANAVEEPFVEVKVSGYVKAGYIFSKVKDGLPLVGGVPQDSSSDFDAEAGVTVKGSVQSTLGEVGASASLKWNIAESSDNAITLADDGFSAFWQFADTMKFDIGRGSGGGLDNGIEKNTRRIWTVAHKRVKQEKAGNGFYGDKGDTGFMGVTYTDGPISMNIRLHDATRGIDGGGFDDDATGISTKGLFTTELINFEWSGGYWGQDDAKTRALSKQTGVNWLAGVGTEINAIPGVSISIGAQTGKLHNSAKTTNVSGSVGFALTDNITAGIGAGWKKVKGSPTLKDNRVEKVVNGGIYYAPMAQLIIGLEGDWLDDGLPAATSNDGFTGAVVTKYSF